MKIYFYLFVILSFCSCTQTNKKNIIRIQKGDTILEGNITNDTLFNDTILYYDLNGKLIRSSVFKEGKQNGISTEYYLNGNPMKITNYLDGYKNGENFYFDSLGKYFYRDFYYFGLPTGPITFFDLKGQPKTFYFTNLQNETLLQIDYQKWRGIKEIYSNCINFTLHIAKEDSTRKIYLLLYLIEPPKFSFKYTIFKKKTASENDFVEVQKIKNDFPFKQISLSILPNDEIYSVGVDIYDSILNKQTIIYKDL